MAVSSDRPASRPHPVNATGLKLALAANPLAWAGVGRPAPATFAAKEPWNGGYPPFGRLLCSFRPVPGQWGSRPWFQESLRGDLRCGRLTCTDAGAEVFPDVAEVLAEPVAEAVFDATLDTEDRRGRRGRS